jgi:hypothetical protein
MIDMDMDATANILSTISHLPSNILAMAPAAPPADFEPSYSKASYYTVLVLYGMSFPGIWSQVKRSTSAKVKRKTYISDGEAVDGGKDLRQQAGEIMACKYYKMQQSSILQLYMKLYDPNSIEVWSESTYISLFLCQIFLSQTLTHFNLFQYFMFWFSWLLIWQT